MELRRILVVGLDVSALATSASNAGYRVHVADLFGDLDTQAVTERTLSLVRQVPTKSTGRIEEVFSADGLVELARQMSKDYSYEGILLSSGLEDDPEALTALEDIAPVLGNTPQIITEVRNKEHFFRSLEEHRILHPETLFASSPTETAKAAKELGYPVIVKTKAGFGGTGVRFVRNEEELASVFHGKDTLVQEYVKGLAVSTSLIATHGHSVTLTVNRQLLGLSSLGSPEAFSYSGNTVPFDATEAVLSRCGEVSAKVAEIFGLKGSNGVDLVIDGSGRPWVIEANPRFQGTLECVENVLGINLVETHIAAYRGGQLPVLGRSNGYCTRLILYGRGRSSMPDLRVFPEVRDVPVPGIIVECGEPLCSIVVKAESSGLALLKGFKVAEAVYSSLC